MTASEKREIEQITLRMIKTAAAVCSAYGVTKGEDRATVLTIILEASRLEPEEQAIARKIILREIKKAKSDD